MKEWNGFSRSLIGHGKHFCMENAKRNSVDGFVKSIRAIAGVEYLYTMYCDSSHTIYNKKS